MVYLLLAIVNMNAVGEFKLYQQQSLKKQRKGVVPLRLYPHTLTLPTRIRPNLRTIRV